MALLLKLAEIIYVWIDAEDYKSEFPIEILLSNNI